MERSTMVFGAGEPEDPLPVALMRLRRGASEWGTWTFDAEDRDAALTVGADRSCDWRIAAAGVAPVELYVRFTGRALHVKSARPYCGARLDGVLLGQDWVTIEHGGRLDLGTACIEATVYEATRTGPEPSVALARTESPKPAPPPVPRAALARSVDNPARNTPVRTSVHPPRSPSPARPFGKLATAHGATQRDSANELAPCVLGGDDKPASPKRLQYLLITAGALIIYALWLALLDLL